MTATVLTGCRASRDDGGMGNEWNDGITMYEPPMTFFRFGLLFATTRTPSASSFFFPL